MACEHALGRRPALSVFGSDYATPDGTCIRDYIHVSDLPMRTCAHSTICATAALRRLLNCGYGHGYGVREVIAAVERACGHALTVIEQPRRAGDPPNLIARGAIGAMLGWQPRHDDLDFIVRTALAWSNAWPPSASVSPREIR